MCVSLNHTRTTFSTQATRHRYASNKSSVMSQFEWYYMLCPSRKIWIWHLKVARPRLTFSWKMGIQYPPRLTDYFDSLLTPYRYGAKTTQIWTLYFLRMSYSSNVRYSNKHQKNIQSIFSKIPNMQLLATPDTCPTPLVQIK